MGSVVDIRQARAVVAARRFPLPHHRWVTATAPEGHRIIIGADDTHSAVCGAGPVAAPAAYDAPLCPDCFPSR